MNEPLLIDTERRRRRKPFPIVYFCACCTIIMLTGAIIALTLSLTMFGACCVQSVSPDNVCVTRWSSTCSGNFLGTQTSCRTADCPVLPPTFAPTLPNETTTSPPTFTFPTPGPPTPQPSNGFPSPPPTPVPQVPTDHPTPLPSPLPTFAPAVRGTCCASFANVSGNTCFENLFDSECQAFLTLGFNSVQFSDSQDCTAFCSDRRVTQDCCQIGAPTSATRQCTNSFDQAYCDEFSGVYFARHACNGETRFCDFITSPEPTSPPPNPNPTLVPVTPTPFPTSALGACCVVSGACVENDLQSSCENKNGTFQGVGITCAEGDCVPIPCANQTCTTDTFDTCDQVCTSRTCSFDNFSCQVSLECDQDVCDGGICALSGASCGNDSQCTQVNVCGGTCNTLEGENCITNTDCDCTCIQSRNACSNCQCNENTFLLTTDVEQVVCLDTITQEVVIFGTCVDLRDSPCGNESLIMRLFVQVGPNVLNFTNDQVISIQFTLDGNDITSNCTQSVLVDGMSLECPLESVAGSESPFIVVYTLGSSLQNETVTIPNVKIDAVSETCQVGVSSSKEIMLLHCNS